MVTVTIEGVAPWYSSDGDAVTGKGRRLMSQNKIVARFQDGRVLKGFTGDFLPTKPTLHLTPADASAQSKPVVVRLADLKAIFFVKDFAGRPQPHSDRQEFDPGKPFPGRKIRVVFKDQEILLGTTQGYDPSRSGFFVIPADTEANNERVFVVTAATQQVSFM
jgi:hypothetical protein